ncbi:MAG: hypothetical protein DRJ06_06030, partial [Candidatus Aminicenantes bacterium]
TTTSSGWQPPPEPANPGGWIPPDEPNEPATTPTPAEIPSPDEIVPYETLIDISNLPKYIHSPGGVTNRIITDLEISNDKISGAFLNINPNPKATIGVAPIRIYFYDAQKNIIKREQWTCEHKYVKDGKRGSYTLTFANCQWPANYCNHTWTGYLQEQKKPIPQLKSMEKFYFSINCLVPNKARYIRIEDT